ncbi:hypothetical protein M441DRAFT_402782 [Trichoderma asperellum CBS 433.97]|uniref:Uncharacterized protein n=1 Tax=Trichoderma asperellum (strain ATCC 204424 / CBS 433.97 / NBRC 101777) TaxID=1042311 RepID=A0A2T3ZA62_TRIA4|nr:hypothetical protein M441DRAFT_402782 [Trichoderma asperellum CBS 433.97]PTB41676.1 hypothetical protein M441DRAFT_402782 [Trichoderma asperellum CBS 433.97]
MYKTTNSTTKPLVAIQKPIYSIQHFICWVNPAMSAALEIAAMSCTRLYLLGTPLLLVPICTTIQPIFAIESLRGP